MIGFCEIINFIDASFNTLTKALKTAVLAQRASPKTLNQNQIDDPAVNKWVKLL
jgi:hypothetical protein